MLNSAEKERKMVHMIGGIDALRPSQEIYGHVATLPLFYGTFTQNEYVCHDIQKVIQI